MPNRFSSGGGGCGRGGGGGGREERPANISGVGMLEDSRCCSTARPSYNGAVSISDDAILFRPHIHTCANVMILLRYRFLVWLSPGANELKRAYGVRGDAQTSLLRAQGGFSANSIARVR